MNIAIITGASSGIGAEYANQIIHDSHRFCGTVPDEVWLVARRAELLYSLRDKLQPASIRIFAEDLSLASGIDEISKALEETGATVSLLVNCAGMGRYGDFEEVSRKDTRSTILLNCAALSELITVCLPHMISLGKAHGFSSGPRVINVASSAGFLPQPGFSVYAASKAYVVSFSQAISAELRPYGIGVTAVCPGPVATDFIAQASGTADAKPKGLKALFLVRPEGLVRSSLRAAHKGKRLYIYSFSQKCLYFFSRVVPTGWMIFMMRKFLGKH